MSRSRDDIKRDLAEARLSYRRYMRSTHPLEISMGVVDGILNQISKFQKEIKALEAQKTIVVTIVMMLQREPGEYPDVAAVQVVDSIVEQLQETVFFTTDQSVPYRVKKARSTQ